MRLLRQLVHIAVADDLMPLISSHDRIAILEGVEVGAEDARIEEAILAV